MIEAKLSKAEVDFIIGILQDPSINICAGCKHKATYGEDCEAGFCDRLLLKLNKLREIDNGKSKRS